MLRTTLLIFLLSAVNAVVAASATVQSYAPSEERASYRLEVSPKRSIVDQPLRMSIVGLEPGERVELRAVFRGYRGADWEAVATFEADSQGRVDPGEQTPVSGSYETPDPMGLFWSMSRVEQSDRPDEEDGVGGFGAAVYPGEHMDVILTARSSTRPTIGDTVGRLFADRDIARISVRDSGIVGTLFVPAGSDPKPAIIIPHGGYCSLPEAPAAVLATHGFVTLALQYCGAEGLPESTASTIPLEYFEKTINWLKTRDEVDAEKIGVMGLSLGGTLALLLGSRFDDIKAAVSIKGSGVLTGFDFTFRGEPVPRTALKGTENIKAAIRAGQPLECKPKLPEGKWACFDFAAVHLYMLLFHGLTNPVSLQEGVIPVEDINGPVLLVSGFDDRAWPSLLYSEIAYSRLKANSFSFPYQHLVYEGAGHRLGIPYTPRTDGTTGSILLGGNARDAGAANADYWPRMIQFLQMHLGTAAASVE